jgi:alkanesulfonate monooxygenase SsuD/methylene tetrahydromethanopterin reductase-like flavin-dependent oxidoreductase (luciferase family)
VPLRNVALAAMEVAGLSRLFPDRLLPGFGHGVLDWMGQVSARAESPMTLLREYLDALRALLAGQTVSRQGRYVNLDDVTLIWPPHPAPPVHVAAIGPRTVALSAELGDGTVLTGASSAEQVRAAREIVDRTRAATGRGGRQHITVYLSTTTGPGAPERLEAENRRWRRCGRRGRARAGRRRCRFGHPAAGGRRSGPHRLRAVRRRAGGPARQVLSRARTQRPDRPRPAMNTSVMRRLKPGA